QRLLEKHRIPLRILPILSTKIYCLFVNNAARYPVKRPETELLCDDGFFYLFYKEESMKITIEYCTS
ncbi:MAG: hypothetical protein D3904_14580, partial [Candidatus Electrothrix sp. EH2]|nr:hypothetical protein [Candidatus Electrothrix sp. EH2]